MCAINKTAGLEDGSLSDDQITSSSHYSGRDPWNARLNNEASFWAAANSRRTGYHWLQIDFGNDTIIKGIRTQGSFVAVGQWVQSLEIETGDDEDILYPIQVNGSIVVSSLDILFPNLWRLFCPQTEKNKSGGLYNRTTNTRQLL